MANQTQPGQEDRLLASIPIVLSNSLGSNLHLHQFPLLSRPLEVPPSAQLSGKKITARRKNEAGRMEIHLPLDLRQDIWNKERGHELGAARAQDDNSEQQAEEARLTQLRLRSETVPDRGASSYMIGILHDDVIRLHPLSEIHQFKPSLTYLDVLSRPSRRKPGDSDEDEEDDGPPPDPDEAPPAPAPKPKKGKAKEGEAKEITVTAKKIDDTNLQGGLSTMRREMLIGMRKEQEEAWVDYDFSAADVSIRYFSK
jgi:DNA-directed RNA polymerase-3 subunit RPC5